MIAKIAMMKRVVMLFVSFVVPLYAPIISSGRRFVKPNQGFFLFPYIYYRHFSPLFATLSATLSQSLRK
jgi:hypothetical protein